MTYTLILILAATTATTSIPMPGLMSCHYAATTAIMDQTAELALCLSQDGTDGHLYRSSHGGTDDRRRNLTDSRADSPRG